MTMGHKQNSFVYIRDCRIMLPIGINPDELDGPQPVIVSVEAEYAPDTYFADPTEKSRDRIIDNHTLYSFITHELPRLGHIHLLEFAAERVADFCFANPRVMVVRVRVEKTEIFSDSIAAGVEVRRVRT
ncbi:MAG: dihydroneopterin aldolase [Alphaproteobacteria bacterium]|nr:dihydroneopterin aldolase [Alphaproteobacteria bacterium]